jgi:hypothetical protein
MLAKIRTADHVQIRYENRTVEGECRLASANGKNMLLTFPATSPLGDYFGTMPVLEDRRGLRDLINRRPVEVTVRGVKS